MHEHLLKMRRVRHATYFVVCLLAVMNRSNASADDATIVRPFIGQTTILVLKVDPTRLAPPDLGDAFNAAFPDGQEAYDRWSQSVTKGIESLRAATDGQAAYATVGIPLSKSEWPTFLFVQETSETGRKQFTDLLGLIHEVSARTHNGLTVVMPGSDIDVEARLNAILPSPREELAEAFEAVKEYPFQVLLLPPGYVRRTVTELMPQLPRQLGGGPSSVLIDGLMWAALGIDPAMPGIELVIQSASEQAARDLAEHLPKMMLSAYNALPAAKTGIPSDTFQALLPLIKPKVGGDRITIRLDEPQSIREGLSLMASAPAAVAEQMRRRENSDRFKQILIAMHNYHNAYKVFPPRDEARDASGKSGLSWRVHILPFLDEKKLYEAFALDQPWDSPHNKPLLEKMPKVYESRWLGIQPGHTTFLAPAGEDTIFGGPKAIRIHSIIDGTSNTVALVEVKPSLSVPWTAPQDYAFDPQHSGAGLRVGTDGRFLAALADGSVQMFRGNAEAEIILRLFQKSDGNAFNWDAVR